VAPGICTTGVPTLFNMNVGNFYVELMDHGLGIERQTRPDLVRLARELDLPLLATNDLHYTFPTDAQAQMSVLMALTPGISIITERIAQPVDGLVQSPFEIGYGVSRPQPLLEFFAAHDFPRPPRKGNQDLEGLFLQLDPYAVFAQFARRKIDLKQPETKLCRQDRQGGAPTPLAELYQPPEAKLTLKLLDSKEVP
jgi:hypothetical protein